MSAPLLTPEDAAVLLIDHQLGTMSWVRSTNFDEMRSNALAPAKAATVFVHAGGPDLLVGGPCARPGAPRVAEIAPEAYTNRIQRVGVINATGDPNCAGAVNATGRPNPIIAGVTIVECAPSNRRSPSSSKHIGSRSSLTRAAP